MKKSVFDRELERKQIRESVQAILHNQQQQQQLLMVIVKTLEKHNLVTVETNEQGFKVTAVEPSPILQPPQGLIIP